jgi:signal transduction histidine kinase
MIVEALDGSLSVETSAAGTTFQISLPIAPTWERVEAIV